MRILHVWAFVRFLARPPFNKGYARRIIDILEHLDSGTFWLFPKNGGNELCKLLLRSILVARQ